jgi:hypothetical protein
MQARNLVLIPTACQVVYSMTDVPLGFGTTAKSTTDARSMDPGSIVVRCCWCVHNACLCTTAKANGADGIATAVSGMSVRQLCLPALVNAVANCQNATHQFPVGSQVFHQSDVGEYLRSEDDLWLRLATAGFPVQCRWMGMYVLLYLGLVWGQSGLICIHLGSILQIRWGKHFWTALDLFVSRPASFYRPDGQPTVLVRVHWTLHGPHVIASPVQRADIIWALPMPFCMRSWV